MWGGHASSWFRSRRRVSAPTGRGGDSWGEYPKGTSRPQPSILCIESMHKDRQIWKGGFAGQSRSAWSVHRIYPSLAYRPKQAQPKRGQRPPQLWLVNVSEISLRILMITRLSQVERQCTGSVDCLDVGSYSIWEMKRGGHKFESEN